MVKGIVKSFNLKTGYGFLTISEEDRDILVHYSTVQASGFKNLIVGQIVYFDYEEKENGKLVATKVVAMRCKKE